MDGAELTDRRTGPSWNPLRCDGTPLPPGWLLTAKLLAFSFFPRNRFLEAGPPFLPFLSLLDSPLFAPWLAPATAAAFYVAFFCLMCNRMVQRACLVIGGSILVHVAGHRLEYSNNVLFASVFLLLIGLYDARTGLLPLRIQLALVYGGASLNKALDPDWWNGRFFDALAMDALSLRWYEGLADQLPERWLGGFCGVITILTEAVICAAILLSRDGRAGVVLMLAFHAVMLFFTLGQLSVPFLYESLAVSAAFFDSPMQVPAAWIPRRSMRWLSAPAMVTPMVWWLAALSIRFFPRLRMLLD